MWFLEQVTVSHPQYSVRLNLAKKRTVTRAHCLASLLVHFQIATHILEQAYNKLSPLMHIRDLLLKSGTQTNQKAVMEWKEIHLLGKREILRGGGGDSQSQSSLQKMNVPHRLMLLFQNNLFFVMWKIPLHPSFETLHLKSRLIYMARCWWGTRTLRAYMVGSWLLGQHFYHGFAIVPCLPSTLALGMDLECCVLPLPFTHHAELLS